MKILGGQYKGRNFYMPAGMRPTQNVTRKAIFDIVGQDCTGLEFIDLFSGSGSVGLEAISRGARRVTFLEKEARFCDIIRENLSLLGRDPRGDPESYQVIQSDAFAAIKQLSRLGRKFDIVFLDPPYGQGLAKKALKTLGAYDILHPDCYIITEHNRRENLPDLEGRFSVVKQRKYGKSFLAVYRGK